jgi:hypothetical protein
LCEGPLPGERPGGYHLSAATNACSGPLAVGDIGVDGDPRLALFWVAECCPFVPAFVPRDGDRQCNCSSPVRVGDHKGYLASILIPGPSVKRRPRLHTVDG